jgi:hypothetical protein
MAVLPNGILSTPLGRFSSNLWISPKTRVAYVPAPTHRDAKSRAQVHFRAFFRYNAHAGKAIGKPLLKRLYFDKHAYFSPYHKWIGEELKQYKAWPWPFKFTLPHGYMPEFSDFGVQWDGSRLRISPKSEYQNNWLPGDKVFCVIDDTFGNHIYCSPPMPYEVRYYDVGGCKYDYEEEGYYSWIHFLAVRDMGKVTEQLSSLSVFSWGFYYFYDVRWIA